ncbi:hypothetical protein POM88_048308 [Heracleum sosnowskyi]|uniref:Uncharacterized protein n=1 Tax=Heracleum sosnowskyi TaxID=360622 RepID=A0AAD8M0H2_9APIA|nr:hypothetical protein POM88_048308 [Heracleum sosnowskyi]
MPRKKVARTRSNYMENTTDGVGYIAGLQPYSSSSPHELMLQQKRSVNVHHLQSYHAKDSIPSVPGVMLNPFHSGHSDPTPSHFLAQNNEYTCSNKWLESCSNSSIDKKLYPVSFAEKTTDTKLLDSSMSGVRSAERSLELNVLHFYHSHPSACQLMSVRSAERSIESNVLHSYHSDPSPCQSMSVRSPERSIEANESHNSEILNIKSSTQVTNFIPSMSDVRPAERSIELNQLFSYRSASKLHLAGLSQDSVDSKALESNYSVRNGKFDLSMSDMRSAERSIVLVN